MNALRPRAPWGLPVIARPKCAFTTTRESQPFAAHHASISR
jgi:hypothetical protein